ncbi:CRAL-TRIO domain containing protein, partial [Oryctes borbonicus]
NRIITLECDLKSLEYTYIFPLPKLLPEGYRVTVHKIADPDQLDIVQLFRYIVLLFDYTIHKDNIRTGEILLYDLKEFKPQHYSKVFNLQLLKLLRFTERNFPYMIKRVYILNCDPLLKKGVNLCKGVLSEKLANRVILTTSEELPKYIPTKYLPKDYGGSGRSLEDLRDQWRKELMANEEFFLEMCKKRPSGAIPEEFKAYENEFGVD